MNYDELRELITLMEASDLHVLELRRPAVKVRLEMDQQMPVIEPQPALPTAHGKGRSVVTAPGFGIFSTRHPSREETFGEEGKQVACGDTLGMLRINELYMPVLSTASGRLHRLVEDDVLIGYATPLFEIVAE